MHRGCRGRPTHAVAAGDREAHHARSGGAPTPALWSHRLRPGQEPRASGTDVKTTLVETVHGAEILKGALRSSVAQRDSAGTKLGRRHFSSVVYFVKFPSGRVLPCRDLAAARREAGAEPPPTRQRAVMKGKSLVDAQRNKLEELRDLAVKTGDAKLLEFTEAALREGPTTYGPVLGWAADRAKEGHAPARLRVPLAPLYVVLRSDAYDRDKEGPRCRFRAGDVGQALVNDSTEYDVKLYLGGERPIVPEDRQDPSLEAVAHGIFSFTAEEVTPIVAAPRRRNGATFGWDARHDVLRVTLGSSWADYAGTGLRRAWLASTPLAQLAHLDILAAEHLRFSEVGTAP